MFGFNWNDCNVVLVHKYNCNAKFFCRLIVQANVTDINVL